jgi:TonB family protein
MRILITMASIGIMLSLVGCAATLATPSGRAVSSTAYNNEIAQQGTSHYCGDGVCDTPPSLLQARAPKYPPSALYAGQSGTVSVLFDIEASGLVSNIRVESATSPEFAASVLVAVKEWRYKPAMLRGKPVKMENMRQTVPFHP